MPHALIKAPISPMGTMPELFLSNFAQLRLNEADTLKSSSTLIYKAQRQNIKRVLKLGMERVE